MTRILLGLFLLLGLSACQHANIDGPAYRINRVIVEPGGSAYGPAAAAQLRSKLQAATDDINRQVSAEVPAHDLVVRLKTVKYVGPNGPFMLGRSKITGEMRAGPWVYKFSGSDDGAPGIAESFDLGGYFSPERSFSRISRRIAREYSTKYARRFGTKSTSWDTLTQATPAPARRNSATIPGRPGLVAPPPQVLIGGSR